MLLMNRIEEIRKQRGMSREDLAKATDLTYIIIWRLENGVTPTTDARLHLIAQALGVATTDLLLSHPVTSTFKRPKSRPPCIKEAHHVS